MPPPPRYAEIVDMAQVAMSANQIDDIGEATILGAIEKRSRFADGYLTSRFTLPLTAWGADLTLAVAQLSAWDVMRAEGYNSAVATNDTWRDGRDEALAWLRDVASGKVTPVGIIDSTPDVTETGISIASDPLRGWGSIR